MNLSEEQLQLIKEYASNLMTWREISILLEIPCDLLTEEFMDENSAASKSYLKGKTETLLQLRSSLVENAKRGSPQSEALVLELINLQRINETDIL